MSETQRLEQVGQREAQLERLAQHLAWADMNGERCELIAETGSGHRCEAKATAVRWEYGFADAVCEHHASTARERGALVVDMRRQDGSETVLLEPTTTEVNDA